MQMHEAATVIQAMAESLRENPAQFHFNVSVATVGTKISVTNGGTGMQVNVSGGASGSRTVGYSSPVSVGDANVQIANQQANAEISRRSADIVRSLDNLVAELRTQRPEQTTLQAIVTELVKTVAPPMMVTAIKALLAAVGVQA